MTYVIYFVYKSIFIGVLFNILSTTTPLFLESLVDLFVCFFFVGLFLLSFYVCVQHFGWSKQISLQEKFRPYCCLQKYFQMKKQLFFFLFNFSPFSQQIYTFHSLIGILYFSTLYFHF